MFHRKETLGALALFSSSIGKFANLFVQFILCLLLFFPASNLTKIPALDVIMDVKVQKLKVSHFHKQSFLRCCALGVLNTPWSARVDVTIFAAARTCGQKGEQVGHILTTGDPFDHSWSARNFYYREARSSEFSVFQLTGIPSIVFPNGSAVHINTPPSGRERECTRLGPVSNAVLLPCQTQLIELNSTLGRRLKPSRATAVPNSIHKLLRARFCSPADLILEVVVSGTHLNCI